MNATIARLTARSLLGGRRALLLAALPVILLGLCVIARSVGAGEDVAVGLLGGFALGTMVPLLGLIVGTGAIGPEIDDGSVVYLLAKPVSRFTIAASKFVVAVAIMLATAAVPTFIAGVVLMGTDGGVAVAYAVGAAVAGIGYGALFLLLAVVSRNAVVIGLVYALVWESLIGGFVPGAQALSIQQWSLAVTESLMGTDAARLGVGAAVSIGTAIVLLVVVTIGGVAYAGARLRTLHLTAAE